MSDGLFGKLPIVSTRLMREAEILLTAIPARPGSLWLDAHSLPAARELQRQGRARVRWRPEPGVWEAYRTAESPSDA